VNAGAASKAGAAAPIVDRDGDLRPSGGGYEIGADELAGGGGGGGGGSAFPNTGLLDLFNRANTPSGGLGANWSATTAFQINGNSVRTRLGVGGTTAWQPQSFGANQEAYFTFTKISTALASEQGLFLKLNGSDPSAFAASSIEVVYVRGSGTVVVRTKSARTLSKVTRASFPVTFAVGDQLGARTLQDGTVSVFKNGQPVGSTNVASGPNPWPSAYAQGGGRIGLDYSGFIFSPALGTDGQLDNFGGGSTPFATSARQTKPVTTLRTPAMDRRDWRLP
jgi:hypothetical protein